MRLLIVPRVYTYLGTLKHFCPIQIIPLYTYTCLPTHSNFCLTDTGQSIQGSPLVHQASTRVSPHSHSLPDMLDKEVQFYRGNSFANSTFKTYSIHFTAYSEFCNKLNISLVPISQQDLGRYITFLSRKLSLNSVRQYLNIVRLLHLEVGLKNPLENNWYVSSILKGVKRVKEDNQG